MRTFHPALQPVRFKPTAGKECPPHSTVSTSVALTEINKINGVNLFHLQSNPTDCFQRTKCRQLSCWQHFFPTYLKSLIGCHSYKWAQIKVGTSGLSKIFWVPRSSSLIWVWNINTASMLQTAEAFLFYHSITLGMIIKPIPAETVGAGCSLKFVKSWWDCENWCTELKSSSETHHQNSTASSRIPFWKFARFCMPNSSSETVKFLLY